LDFSELTQLKRRYAGQAGQLVNEFYIPVLSRSIRYDRQAGYFDSSSLVQVAAGLATFIANLQTSVSCRPFPVRLIAGATWTEADTEAYAKGRMALETRMNQTLLGHFEPSDEECLRLGLPRGWRPEADQIARHRLGTLAWMVASQLMDIRIALPLDPDGRPYLPGRNGALFHPKSGLLYDAAGRVILFQGSVNETGAAWTRNREKFEVRRSWYSDQDREDIEDEMQEFEKLWNRKDSHVLILPLPQAVRERLIDFAPRQKPASYDPMDPRFAAEPYPPEDRLMAQSLLEAPKMPGGHTLVLEPLWADGQPFTPYPHQKQVIDTVVCQYPRPFLFCDEVGLGKTVEAGVALRALMLAGRIRRILLIAPRSLIRQWMEELREKLALTGWFYDGREMHDVGGRVRQSTYPLEEDGIVMVSRHLIARNDRRDEVLSVGRPWDLVIVDEAHAARRRGFGNKEPNQLLGLLTDLKIRRLAGCFWLLTATPMQIDPDEVHDLLTLCGLDEPSWKPWSSAQVFNRFFDRLRIFRSEPGVRKEVMDLARIAVQNGAPELDENAVPLKGWGSFQWKSFLYKVKTGEGLMLTLQQMIGDQAEGLTPILAKQTPLAVMMFRHTRSTLRAYAERGLLKGLASRKPEDAPVHFQTPEERELYLRIDDLCRQFYRLADIPADERSGVGFLMAVFRKRLSSSFTAFRKSLERRKRLIDDLEQALQEPDCSTEWTELYPDDEDEDDREDVEAAFEQEIDRLIRIRRDPDRMRQIKAERMYLKDYIQDLSRIVVDSKFLVFQGILENLLNSGHRLIVFTQYLDTLDDIRERLESRYLDRMACYSGRGGEIWNPVQNGWVVVEKCEIKARSRTGHSTPIHILLGTDAASEGLNLQSFSALINYDLPWNPMRVEQRIGRIDRIGQQAPEVCIVNLYMKGTIEEDAYITLKTRIGSFADVVGPLQPILAQMPRIFRQIARGEMELEEARNLLDQLAAEKPPAVAEAIESVMENRAEAISDIPPASPVTQERLAAFCLAHPAPDMRIIAVPEPGNGQPETDGLKACLSINWISAPAHLGISPTEEILATFNGQLADRHPPTAPALDEFGRMMSGREGVRLLTWGDPVLVAWLKAVQGNGGIDV
jgi:superfamily II DNA or RNA helicase